MYRTDGFRVARGTLPSGDAGTRKTLEIMRQEVVNGARDPEVMEAAISVVRDAGALPHDHLAEAGAIFRFVRDRVRFTDDPIGIEKIQGARYTLHVMAGDCDDRATLIATMLRAIGISSRFRVVAANPRVPGAFSHVYVVATIDGHDVPLDPTYASNQLGGQYAPATRMADFPL
jgi:transglutaminase-like putative cysteine protease